MRLVYKSTWKFYLVLGGEEKSLGQAVLHADQVCQRLRPIRLAPEWSLVGMFLVHCGPRTVVGSLHSLLFREEGGGSMQLAG